MKKNILFFVLFIATVSVHGQQVRDGINAARFGLSQGKDATPVILKALDACYESGASRLTIPKGTYHFYPDYALEEYLALTGSANGLRRIAFPLINFENLIIDGSGSTLVIHGMMLPFEIQECRNISIRNVAVRFASPVWGEGTVTEVDQPGHFFTVETNPADSLTTEQENLVQIDHAKNRPVKIVGWLGPDGVGNCSFTPSVPETSGNLTVKPLRHGSFWMEVPPQQVPRKGMKMVWEADSPGLAGKVSPAFHLSGSEGVTLSNVSLVHVPGRALVAEQSGNVMLDRLSILPDTLAGQELSARAGGVRFIGCQKQIVMTNCRFSGILGDAISVSGPTLEVVRRISDQVVGVRQKNKKQWGSQFAQVGDTVRFISPAHPNLRSERVVTRIRDLNEQYQELWFNRPLSEEVQTGALLTNLSRQPRVILHGNRLFNTIGDGIKLETSGTITVEGNQIRSGRHGMNLGGDWASAFRPVMLNHVFVKSNTFRRCNANKTKDALILIAPAFLDAPGDTTFVHKDVTLEGNTFYSDGATVLDAVSTVGLVIRRNTIFDSNALKTSGPVVRLRHCSKVGIVGNRYMKKQEAYMQADQVKDLLFFDNEGIKAP